MHIGKGGGIDVDSQANVRAVVFFAAGYIIELSAIRKKRHELLRVFGGGLSEIVQPADQLLIAVLRRHIGAPLAILLKCSTA